jgi:hypothetical protein
MKHRKSAALLLILISLTLPLALAQHVWAWAIGSETEVTNEHVAHQYIAQEGWKLFKYQFGPSEIDSYVGAATEYPSGPNTGWIEGVYDEDMRGENPFSYTATANHPSLRHFWAPHTIGWARDFDDGLGTFDSAANMAIKYFTGGYGLKGSLDSAWGDGQGAVVGQGIPQVYSANKGTAYYWFGHTIHLVQDLAVPAHSHGDAHQEDVWFLADDPDPVHDYVDGKEFNTNANNGRPYADFNDVNPTRYTMWKFQGNAVGRAGVASSMLSSDLPSPQSIVDKYNNSSWPTETMQSVPSGYTANMLPMYILYAETAREAAQYDTKDYNGQSDQGNRNSDYRTIDPTFSYYNNWTQTEIEEVADQMVPNAMYVTAAMIRYFYSRVDSTAPGLSWTNLGGDANNPLNVFASGGLPRSLAVELTVDEPTSGVDQDGFKYFLQKRSGNSWIDIGSPFTTGNSTTLSALSLGDYRVWAKVETGAGLTGESPFGYFTIFVPEPVSCALAAVGAAAMLSFRRRPKLVVQACAFSFTPGSSATLTHTCTCGAPR